MRVRPTTGADAPAIDRLLRSAFGGGEEARLVALLRDDGLNLVDLVAEVDGAIVGQVLLPPLEDATTGTFAGLTLAPLAVDPAHQRRGIGTALVQAALKGAKAIDGRLVVVLGDPAYYLRFGFTAEAAAGIACIHSGPHLMAIDLTGLPSAIERQVRYPWPFAWLAEGRSLGP